MNRVNWRFVLRRMVGVLAALSLGAMTGLGGFAWGAGFDAFLIALAFLVVLVYWGFAR